MTPWLIMSSRVPLVEVASIGKWDGTPARACRYLVLFRRGLLEKRVAQLPRTVEECGAVLTIVGVATAPSVLDPVGLSSSCPKRLVRGMARRTEHVTVEEVWKPSASQYHRVAIKLWATSIPRLTRVGCRCGGAGLRGSTCPARATSLMTARPSDADGAIQ